MTTTPLLTIITICYNAEVTIAPTLRSLAEQSDQSFEYLVIDGASQDKTLSLVQTLYPCATIYSEPDYGLYDAMNKGLRHATGTYIWYLNGDTMIVDGAYQDLHPRRLRPPHQLTQRSFANGMLICHQAFIPRRSLAPLYDLRYRYSADYDWCIKIIDAIQSQYRIDDYLVNYLNEGVTTRNHRASLLERLRIMAHRYGWPTAIARHVSFLFRRQR